MVFPGNDLVNTAKHAEVAGVREAPLGEMRTPRPTTLVRCANAPS